MNLVANYSSSEASDQSCDEANNSIDCEKIDAQYKLPKPLFKVDVKESVFTNKYAVEENEKQAVLEQHVKMSEDIRNLNTVNGKKICWEYRKGRCRFGHKCRFVHDSDVALKDNIELKSELKKEQEKITKNTIIAKLPVLHVNNSSSSTNSRKKRLGLCQTLQPSKKIMSQFKKLNQDP